MPTSRFGTEEDDEGVRATVLKLLPVCCFLVVAAVDRRLASARRSSSAPWAVDGGGGGCFVQLVDLEDGADVAAAIVAGTVRSGPCRPGGRSCSFFHLSQMSPQGETDRPPPPPAAAEK